jgi:hypothetical protein
MLLNKNSWHHRLAYFYGPLYWWQDGTNVCEYASAMMRGLFTVLLATFVGAVFLAAPFADFLVWLYVGVTVGWTEPQFLCIGFLLYLGVGVAVGIAWGIVYYFEGSGDKLIDRVTNSVVYRVAHSWAHKYCFSISFK